MIAIVGLAMGPGMVSTASAAQSHGKTVAARTTGGERSSLRHHKKLYRKHHKQSKVKHARHHKVHRVLKHARRA
jgi:hypothetical protein